MDKIVFVDECLHVACKECLKEAIDKSYPEVTCLAENCKAKLNDYEMRAIMGQKEYEDV